MKLYLDNSFLNRPFDDPNVGQNKLEAEILLFIIGLGRKGYVELVNSAMITYENSANLVSERKIFVDDVMKLASSYQDVDDRIRDRAKVIVKEFAIKPLDALHIAIAESAGLDMFITCDRDLPKKYKGNLPVKIPVEFLTHYENNENNH